MQLLEPRLGAHRSTVSVAGIQRCSLKVSADTSNTGRNQYFARNWVDRRLVLKLRSQVSSIFCLLWLPWLEIWSSLKTKLSTVDCLASHRFDVYYRIVWRVQKNRAKGYGKAISLLCLLVLQSHSWLNVVRLINTCLASVCISSL